MDGMFFFYKKRNLTSLENSLNAGVSINVNLIREAIPQSAFVDAVKDYVAYNEINGEGSMVEA